MVATFFRNVLHAANSFVQRFGAVKSATGAVVVVAAVLLGVHVLTRSASAPAAPAQISHVQVSTVSALSSATGPLVVTGKVNSLNQATILAQTSGQITTLNKAVGDYVAAGGIIAEFENSSQQAALAQAQGSLDAAEANLAEVEGPTGASAQTGAVNALLSAYGAVDSAIRGTADTMISNPDSVNPQFNITSSDSQLAITIENDRTSLGAVWSRERARAQTLSPNDDLNAELSTTINEVRSTRSFLDAILEALNTAIPNQSVSQAMITADIAATTAARTSLTTALSSLAAAQTTLQSGGSGSTSPDIAAAEAQVAQMQGALAATQSNLDKTVVRSPISGVIVSLPVNQGDYVSTNAPVAQVSNPGALEVDTAVTPDDARTLLVGGKATIDSDTDGVIVSISPALDPTTGEIPVKVGIVGSQSALTDGETVTLSLARTSAPPAQAVSGAMVIPIDAAKITPQGAVVFTVSSSTTLIANPITLGTILGDQITVLSGLTPQMQIVTDARGLSSGQTVIVDSQ